MFLLALSGMLVLSGPDPGEVDTTRVYVMDPIVVTGTRLPAVRSEIPHAVSVVDREAIVQSGESNVLPVLAEKVPGLFVTERGVVGFGVAEGAAGGISIRGVGGSPNTRVLVLIDGHPQFMGIFGHPLPDAYAASGIERVEVVRGPASCLYGTGAMGGAINLVTRGTQKQGLAGEARASLGSHGTERYAGSLGYRRDRFGAFASVNHDHTDGHRGNDEFTITNGYVKADYRLGRGLGITASGSVASFRAVDPGPAASPHPDDTPHWADIERAVASLALSTSFGRAEGEVKLFVNTGEHELYDGFHSTDALGGVVAFQGLRLAPGTTLTFGLDLKRYGGEAEITLSRTKLGDHTVTETGVYLSMDHRLVPALGLHAGIRVERHPEFGTETVPQAGLAFHATPTTALKASAAKGFRSPTIRELYLFRSANPDLEPERMCTYQTSLLHRFPGERGSLEVTGFTSTGDNLIQTVGQFPNVRNENTGEFTHRGLEVEARYGWRAVDAWASYAFLDTEDPVIAAPRHHLSVGATATRGMVTATLQARRVAGLVTRVSGDEVSEQAFTLVKVTLALRPRGAVEAFLEGDNLLDEEYEINHGYPMPGATFAGGITLRY